ncbi:hypothetical protein SAMN05444161_3560 [Rhizobiales bacterium GAS191]|nr:hypothetical protein SAMN05444161_3560 [Rhizobiales bacterium GAS191]
MFTRSAMSHVTRRRTTAAPDEKGTKVKDLRPPYCRPGAAHHQVLALLLGRGAVSWRCRRPNLTPARGRRRFHSGRSPSPFDVPAHDRHAFATQANQKRLSLMNVDNLFPALGVPHAFAGRYCGSPTYGLPMGGAGLDFRTGKLWSLWDVLRIFADKFVFMMNALAALQREMDKHSSETIVKLLDPTGQIGPGLRRLVEIFTELEMPVSKRDAEALLQMHERQEERPIADVLAVISTLWGSVAAEFEGRLVIATGLSSAKLYEPKEPLFGSDVSSGFSSATYEIDEAGKCLALGRSTASVFHLMRILEIGIKASSACLSIPDPIKDAERNWGVMLRKFKDEMDRRNNVAQPRWNTHTDKDFFAEIYASLDAVRNVWRNAAMHVETKYTVEEADHILGAVRGFMKKLASRMDEQGRPLA